MKRLILALALLLPTMACAQHAGEFDSSLAETKLAGEKDKDGDRVQVNLKGVSATPTPALANRCAIQCDAVADQLVASVNGGAFEPIVTGVVATDCSCPGAGLNSSLVGTGAAADGVSSVAVGHGASAAALQSIAIGKSASSTAANCTTVGYGSSCSTAQGACVGDLCTITGSVSACVGSECTVTGDQTVQLGQTYLGIATATGGVCLGALNLGCTGTSPICIGRGANCTNGGNCIGDQCSESSSNKIGIGSSIHPIQNVCVGHGCATTSESVAGMVRASDLSGGTDKNAGPLQLRGGAGTGAGTGGNIQFQSCPSGSTGSAVNSCMTQWHLNGETGALISDGGNLGASGASVPASYFEDVNMEGQTTYFAGGATVTGGVPAYDGVMSIFSDSVVISAANGLFAGFVLLGSTQWNDDNGTIELFQNSLTITNQTGESRTWSSISTFVDDSTVTTDANSTITLWKSFDTSPTFGTTAGTLTIGTLYSYSAGIQVDAGATVNTRRAFDVGANGGAGTIVDDVGLRIPVLTGTNIVGISNESPTVFPATAQNLAGASAVIGSDTTAKALTNSTGGTLTLTSIPTIADPDDAGITGGKARFLILVNVDNADSIVIQDESSLAGSNVKLNGSINKTLGTGDSLTLYFAQDLGYWIEIASSNN